MTSLLEKPFGAEALLLRVRQVRDLAAAPNGDPVMHADRPAGG